MTGRQVEERTVQVTVDERYSFFRCPACDRKISIRAAYPFRFQFRTCPGCDATWSNHHFYTGGDLDWERRDEVPAGYSRNLRLFRLLRPDPARAPA